MRLRQVGVLCQSLPQPHAPKAAGADGRHGLHRLIAHALGIRPGVEHDLDALQAIGLIDAHAHHRCQPHQSQPLQLVGFQPRHPQHHNGYAQDNAGSSHVRLHLHRHKQKSNKSVLGVEDIDGQLVLHPVGEDIGRYHHAAYLGKLRRLEGECPQVNPPLCTVDHSACRQHKKQQCRYAEGYRPQPVTPLVVIHPPGHGKQHEAYPHADEMLQKVCIGCAILIFCRNKCRAKNIYHPHYQQHRH